MPSKPITNKISDAITCADTICSAAVAIELAATFSVIQPFERAIIVAIAVGTSVAAAAELRSMPDHFLCGLRLYAFVAE